MESTLHLLCSESSNEPDSETIKNLKGNGISESKLVSFIC